MKLLVGFGAGLVLWFFLRDRRTPAQRLADAYADDNLEYLAQHLPQITAGQAESLGLRLAEEEPGVDTGSPEWRARWNKTVFEERRQKYRTARLFKVTR